MATRSRPAFVNYVAIRSRSKQTTREREGEGIDSEQSELAISQGSRIIYRRNETESGAAPTLSASFSSGNGLRHDVTLPDSANRRILSEPWGWNLLELGAFQCPNWSRKKQAHDEMGPSSSAGRAIFRSSASGLNRRISSILHAHAKFLDQDGERPADELAIRSAPVRRAAASRDG
jgi:hypothetical protein